MHFKNLSQKMVKMSALTAVGVVAGMMFMSTDAFSALPKKKLDIIIGGDNFCKDDKDCAGDSFCNMTSHICITCPKPFEWVGGTQCVCPSGTVPNADNTDCVECMTDENCQDLKGKLYWVCDTDNNTCECLSGLHQSGEQCVCDDAHKEPNVDGNCVCQLNQAKCPDSDFTDNKDCTCCPTATPKWYGFDCKTCKDIDATKPYYNPSSHTCVECLTDAQCTDGVCIDNACYPCREDSDCAGNKVCQDKQCVCEITSTDCPASDFVAEQCMCCPSDEPKWNETTKMCEVCPTDQPYYSTTQQTCIMPTCADFGLTQGLLATYVRGQECNIAWRDGFGPFYQLWGAYDWMHIYGSAGNYCKDNAITLIGQLYAPVEGIYTYQLWARPDDDEKNIDQVDVHVDGILQYTVWGVDENNQGRLANTVSLNLKPGLHSFAYWGDQNERGGITLLPVSVPAHTMFCH